MATTTKYDIDGTGVPNTRLNIDDFSTNDSYKVRWSLFLRALGQLQLAPITDPLGYFRIAGIHGWPLDTWPDLQAQVGKTIYCSHGTTRFLTWHRPYLLLLEQRIVEVAVTLAALAPDNLKQEYNTEALKIRIPFWDWAYIPALPAAAVNKDAYVIIPEQDPLKPIRIDNPLYSYKFTGPSMPPVDGPTTTRYLDDKVKGNLIGAGLRTLVYHALISKNGYAPFSNTLHPPPSSSIEKPHNSVHEAISRVMNEPMVTGFDPIFWVFHAVMDRYYVLWQTINPDVLYGENYPGPSTVDQWLAPFNRSIGPWTSRMVQKSDSPSIPTTWEYGYQYPETLVEWTNKQRLDAVWATIVKYYAPAGSASKEYPPGAIHRGDRLTQPGYPVDLPDKASIRREWRVLIKVKNNLVAGNFTVFVFLGDSGENTEEWGRHPNTAGSVSTFKAALENCGNCQAKQGDYMYGSVYLTDKLHKVLPQGTRLEDQVSLTPWLSNKLDWRIRQADGTEVHLADGDTTSLSVGVESFMEAYAPVDQNGNPIDCDLGKILGRTFDHVKHPEITAGKSNKGGDTLSS